MRRLLLVLAVVLLPACGGEEATNEAGSGSAVEIVLDDFTLEPETLSLDPGTVTFHVVNEGSTAHALEIEGASLEQATEELAPGDSAELVLELEAGEYELYCPVGDHRDGGMEGTLTVGDAGGMTPEETTTEEPGYRY